MSKKEFTVNDQDWAHELEKGVETYTDMLFEAVWDDGGAEITETLSEEPFCGCSNCFWRETLFFLINILYDADIYEIILYVW